ncbi:MAG: transposase [Clostridia bacterium]
MGDDELVLPKRKPNRLKDYDYSQNGAYFITICTKDRSELLWMVGARIARPQAPAPLSAYGVVIEGAIQKIAAHYPCISVPKYVVMPNHIHMILVVANDGGRAMRAPTLATVLNQMKGYVTKQIGFSPWQKLYHDHIIRNEREYQKIWDYIDTNPSKWEEDCFYHAQN